MLKHHTLIIVSILSLSLISINGCSNFPLLPESLRVCLGYLHKSVQQLINLLVAGTQHDLDNSLIAMV